MKRYRPVFMGCSVFNLGECDNSADSGKLVLIKAIYDALCEIAGTESTSKTISEPEPDWIMGILIWKTVIPFFGP